jgi:hypothetical protein
MGLDISDEVPSQQRGQNATAMKNKNDFASLA